MDKLKQVLKYRFWILLGIALILPLTGWFLSRSGLVSEAEARTTALKKLSGDLKAGPEDPNADWQNGLKQINDVQKTQVQQAWIDLYERQREFMVWPEKMVDDPEKILPKHQEYYRTHYVEELAKVRQIVKPLDDLGETGLVDLSDDLLPHPEDDWLQAPKPKEIEAAQEDLWLLTALLKAIAEVNSTATSQVDAAIPQITYLQLRGGGGTAGGPAGMGGALGGAEYAGDKTGPGGLAGGGMGRGMGRGGIGGLSQAGVFDPDASFNPDDEFGTEVPDEDDAAAAGGGLGAGLGAGGPALGGGGKEYGGDMPGAGGRMGMAGMKMKRYVDDSKAEWKTRGFYIELVMDHRKVPDLLVALANADWPIRVTRVQQADYMDEELVPEQSGGPGGRMPGGADMLGGAGRRGGAAAMRPMRAARPMGGDDADDRRGLLGGKGLGALAGGGGRVGRAKAAPGRAGGAAGMPGMGGMAGGSQTFDNHMLANVALDGLITIFKKPPEEPAPEAGSQSLPGQQDPTGAPAETAVPPADTAAEGAPGDVSAPVTDETTEPVGEDEKGTGESAPVEDAAPTAGKEKDEGEAPEGDKTEAGAAATPPAEPGGR